MNAGIPPIREPFWQPTGFPPLRWSLRLRLTLDPRLRFAPTATVLVGLLIWVLCAAAVAPSVAALSTLPLAGVTAGTYSGPVAIVTDPSGHAVCSPFGEGQVCVQPRVTSWGRVLLPTSARPTRVPVGLRFTVSNSSSQYFLGASSDSTVAVGAEEIGSYGSYSWGAYTPYRVTLGPTCASAGAGYEVAPGASAVVCASLDPRRARAAGLLTEPGPNRGLLAYLQFGGIAEWEFTGAVAKGPSACISPAVPGPTVPAIASSSDRGGFLSQFCEEGDYFGTTSFRCSTCEPISLDQVTTVDGATLLHRVGRLVQQVPHRGLIVVGLSQRAPGGAELPSRLRDAFVDGQFDCTHTGCSVMRVGASSASLLATVPGCDQAISPSCMVFDFPQPTRIQVVGFLYDDYSQWYQGEALYHDVDAPTSVESSAVIEYRSYGPQ